MAAANMYTRKGVPSLKELNKLAKEICDCWESLGVQLHVESLESIKHDNVDYPRPEGKAYAMLKKWLDKGSSSTYHVLAEGLKNVEKQGLVENYCLVERGKDEGKEELGEREDPPLLQDIKDVYERRHSWIHPFSWLEHFQMPMEDVFTRLVIAPREKGLVVNCLARRTVGMFEIFEPTDHCKHPRRVLVEADPGMGKTTFLEKLCLDWANGKTEPPFPDIPLVLFLKCRDMSSSDDLKDAVADQLLPEDAPESDRQALSDFIDKNQQDILLVFDGMDELEEEVDCLSKLIEGKKGPKFRLLVTTRHNDRAASMRQHFDSLFEIAGYTMDDAKKYIRKYFEFFKNEEKGSQLLQRIDETFNEDGNATTVEDATHLKELLFNPLRASLLCAAYEEQADELPTLSPTLLYDEVTSCILKRHFKREHKEEDPPEQPLVHYHKELQTVGKLALQSSQAKQLYFNRKELAGSLNVEKLGFLRTEQSASKLRPFSKCSFLHRTFQEYLAARYACERLVLGEFAPYKFIRRNSDDISGFAQIFRFCAGILAARGATTVFETFMISLTGEATASHHMANTQLNFCLLCDCVGELSMAGGESCEDQKERLCAFIGKSITWPVLGLAEAVVGETSTRWKVLCQAIKSLSSNVQELYLPHNQLTDVSLLVSALEHNSTLRILDLRGNQIADLTGLEGLVQGKKLRIAVGSGKYIGTL